MKNPKLIIFDLDGTFYDINDVIESVYDCQVAFFSTQRHISVEAAKDIFVKNSIFPYASPESKSCTEYFERNGIDKWEWAAYRESHFDVTKIDVSKAVSPAVIRQYAEAYRICLLSSNTYVTIQKILSRLGIDAKLFTRIISSDRFVSSNKFNKREAMSAIIRDGSLESRECLSIGDRYNTDILPILELGGSGVLVKAPYALGCLLEDLRTSSIERLKAYEYFTN